MCVCVYVCVPQPLLTLVLLYYRVYLLCTFRFYIYSWYFCSQMFQMENLNGHRHINNYYKRPMRNQIIFSFSNSPILHSRTLLLFVFLFYFSFHFVRSFGNRKLFFMLKPLSQSVSQPVRQTDKRTDTTQWNNGKKTLGTSHQAEQDRSKENLAFKFLYTE